jgi:hypothetical protein
METAVTIKLANGIRLGGMLVATIYATTGICFLEIPLLRLPPQTRTDKSENPLEIHKSVGIQGTTAKRDKKELRSFLSLLICPALSGYPEYKGKRGAEMPSASPQSFSPGLS